MLAKQRDMLQRVMGIASACSHFDLFNHNMMSLPVKARQKHLQITVSLCLCRGDYDQARMLRSSCDQLTFDLSHGSGSTTASITGLITDLSDLT